MALAIVLFTLYLLREHWEIKSSFSLILFRLGIQYFSLLLSSWSEVNAKSDKSDEKLGFPSRKKIAVYSQAT